MHPQNPNISQEKQFYSHFSQAYLSILRALKLGHLRKSGNTDICPVTPLNLRIDKFQSSRMMRVRVVKHYPKFQSFLTKNAPRGVDLMAGVRGLSSRLWQWSEAFDRRHSIHQKVTQTEEKVKS